MMKKKQQNWTGAQFWRCLVNIMMNYYRQQLGHLILMNDSYSQFFSRTLLLLQEPHRPEYFCHSLRIDVDLLLRRHGPVDVGAGASYVRSRRYNGV